MASGLVGALVGLAAGFLLGAWDRFTVAPEVNITDLLTLVATVVLTVLVAIVAQKRFGEDRAEKDLLIGVNQASLDRLREVHSVFRAAYYTGKPDLDATTQALDALAATLSELAALLDSADHRSAFPEAQTLSTTDLFALRRLTSGGGFPAEPYPQETFDAEAQLVRDMEERLRRLVFTINRR